MTKVLLFPFRLIGGILMLILVGFMNLYLAVHKALGRRGIIKKNIKGYPYRRD